MSRLIVLTFILALLAPGLGAAQTERDYVIGPQDVLTIALFDQPDLGGRYAVELDGSFSFPLIGRINAGGLTLRDFETELKARLADGFFKNPQVTVGVGEYRSQRVFVTGEVRTPGAIPLTRDMTLIEALAKAGSTTQFASDEVVVVRGGSGTETPVVGPNGQLLADASRDVLRINLQDLQSGVASKENLVLRNGDQIFVARAEEVFVFGQVKLPGSYSIKTGTSVLQALSLAGGVLPTGAMNRVRIIRSVDGEKKEFRVELSETVKPGDTLVVPERYF